MSAWGAASLIIVLAAATAATGLWIGAARRARLRSAARAATALAFGAAASASAAMLTALLTDPGALAYSHRAIEPGMPLYYQVTSLWAGLEGSLLLWLLLTALVAAGFALARPAPPLRTRAVASAALSAATAAFAVVALVTDPFAPAVGAVGERPSPLLQDHPAMGLHPPLLYLGFTALAVPYALSVGAMVTREWDARWAATMHAWTAAGWISLTAGIGLGAWWSYAVLGWGGYWAWDPVENASLLPWLLATALLHTVGPRARSSGWRRAAIGLGAAAYGAVLLATWLTRGGAVASIHAFSVSEVGPVLLALLCVAVAVPCVLALRRGGLPPRPRFTALTSRQTALRVQRIGLVVVAGVVLVGTVLPTVIATLTGAATSVGPPWFERILGPIALVLLVVMAVAPWLRWHRDTPGGVLRRMRVPLLVGGIGVVAVALTTREPGLAVCAGLGLVIACTVAVRVASGSVRGRTAVGGAVAHLGVVVAAVAIASGGGAVVSERSIAVGEGVSAGSVTAVLVGVERTPEGRRDIESARLVLADGDRLLGEVEPELRWYGEHGAVLAGPVVRSEPLRDVYVTLLGVDAAAGGATVRLAVMPLVPWLWASGVLMMAGAAIAAVPRRSRRVTPVPVARAKELQR